MKVVDLADEISRELEGDSDVMISSITYWLLNNIGQLNILLNECIEIVADDFSPELSIEQANIFKVLYLIKYYSKKIQQNLGAAAYDWSEVSEGDSSIRRVSKNEVAKNYKQMRDSYNDDLKALVFYYKNNQIEPDSWGDEDFFE